MKYQPPQIVDLGPIAGHTYSVPPGCTDNCVSHKGFTNPNTPDNSTDQELSSSDGGPG